MLRTSAGVESHPPSWLSPGRRCSQHATPSPFRPVTRVLNEPRAVRYPGRVVARHRGSSRETRLTRRRKCGGRGAVSGSCHDKAMTLMNLYSRIYSHVRWPAPLPRPEEVRFCWNHRFETTSGVCYQKGKIIEVNITYRDPRLSRELEYLVIHEAAHFIWRDHSPAFRAFLRSVGVPQDYILHQGEASPMYRLVQEEQAQ